MSADSLIVHPASGMSHAPVGNFGSLRTALVPHSVYSYASLI